MATQEQRVVLFIYPVKLKVGTDRHSIRRTSNKIKPMKRNATHCSDALNGHGSCFLSQQRNCLKRRKTDSRTTIQDLSTEALNITEKRKNCINFEEFYQIWRFNFLKFARISFYCQCKPFHGNYRGPTVWYNTTKLPRVRTREIYFISVLTRGWGIQQLLPRGTVFFWAITVQKKSK